MTLTRYKIILFIVGTFLATSSVIFLVKKFESHPWQVEYYNRKLLQDSEPLVEIVPSKFKTPRGWGTDGDKVMGIGQPAEVILLAAYEKMGVNPARAIIKADLPNGNYDFIASLPNGSREALQALAKKKFGAVVKHEQCKESVLLLVVHDHNASHVGLKPSKPSNGFTMNGFTKEESNQYAAVNQPLQGLVFFLENILQIPILDQTGLQYSNFDINLKWNNNGAKIDSKALHQALLEQLDLELIPDEQDIDMIVIEKPE